MDRFASEKLDSIALSGTSTRVLAQSQTQDGWMVRYTNHLVGSTFDHDKSIIVTAGIGITAFLSMFTEMIEILCFNEDGMFIKMQDIQGVPLTKEFSLHWMC
mmetsp:Transcript_63205/g.72689  ORF Transcript_63205/g.72689 Transcript_63205/m.72689 type:complete len:102 (+) Transcript_63205:107-412(+)